MCWRTTGIEPGLVGFEDRENLQWLIPRNLDHKKRDGNREKKRDKKAVTL